MVPNRTGPANTAQRPRRAQRADPRRLPKRTQITVNVPKRHRPYDLRFSPPSVAPKGREDVIPFLRNVTAGRGIPASAATHYRANGISPINEQNQLRSPHCSRRCRARPAHPDHLGEPQLEALRSDVSPVYENATATCLCW